MERNSFEPIFHEEKLKGIRDIRQTVQPDELLFLRFLLEHDGELFEGLFGHASSIAGLDLLLQIVFHTHGQLIQLIPLLSKVYCAVFCVPGQTTNHMLMHV